MRKAAASGTRFARGASAFRISPELGQGRFILRAPNQKGDGLTYHYVQERQSNVVLQMHSAREGYLYGQNLRVDTHLKDMAGNTEFPVRQISGFLRSPDGKIEPLRFQRDADGAFVGQMPLKQGAVAVPDLWEVHAKVRGASKGGAVVRRNVKTAFGYTVPQARLLDHITIEKQEGILSQASGSIRQCRALPVTGHAIQHRCKGEYAPIMMTDGAAWLEAGGGELTLIFDQTLLAASGLSAPFEVRHLQLLDHSQMEVLRREDHALRFEL